MSVVPSRLPDTPDVRVSLLVCHHARMRVDHVSYAAEHSGLIATANWLGEQIGVAPIDGGVHPQFGTRNMILPLAHQRYVEIVEVLDHPSAEKAPFGQAVRARTEAGGGWMAWVVAVDELAPVEKRLSRTAMQGHRTTPDGYDYRWKQIGIKGLIADPQLPYFIHWESEHPSASATSEVTIEKLTLAGDSERVCEWLGLPASQTSTVIDFDFVAPHGTPGLLSVTFATARGLVTI